MCTSHFGADFQQKADHDNETGDGKDDLGITVQFPSGTKDSFSSPKRPDRVGSHITSSLMGSFPGAKMTGQ
jgi:hypothetical protein